MSKELFIVTHNGNFHADDLFACAVLQLIIESEGNTAKIVRTRDFEIISKGNYVVDVGDIYDPNMLRFDHHQKEGAGARENGIPYASIGLVWKMFGEKLCGSKKLALKFDEKIVQPIDADDNGVDLFKTIRDDVDPLTIQRVLYSFRPTWKEKNEFDSAFVELLPFVKNFILRQIKVLQDKEEARRIVEYIYEQTADKRLIVIDGSYPASNVLEEKPEPLFFVYKRAEDGRWGINTLAKAKDSFESRKYFPENWAGLRGEELQKVTGVADAVFCHRARFLVVTKTKEGAIALARKALAV